MKLMYYFIVCVILAVTYVIAVYASDAQGRHMYHILEDELIQLLYFPAVLMVAAVRVISERV